MKRLLIRPGDPFQEKARWEYSNSSARVSCPGCGVSGSLEDTHAIDPVTGDVSPSIACGQEGCDFHRMITLSAWVPR